jgi:hypothetical protein
MENNNLLYQNSLNKRIVNILEKWIKIRLNINILNKMSISTNK